MNNFSPLSDCSLTSSDTISITGVDISTFDTISVTNNGSTSISTVGTSPGYYTTNTMGTITIGSGLSGYGSGIISGLTSAQISTLTANPIVSPSYKLPEEFVDCLPNIDRIKKMCEEYPGLKISYEKFVTTYKLVKDHYDTPKDQRPIP